MLRPPRAPALNSFQVKGIGLGISRRIGAFLSGEPDAPAPIPKERAPTVSSIAKQKRLERAPSEPERNRTNLIQLMKSVPGIGSVLVHLSPHSVPDVSASATKAVSIVDMGCETIAQLRAPGKYRNVLSPAMQAGVDHFDFLDHTISREQAEDLLVSLLS